MNVWFIINVKDMRMGRCRLIDIVKDRFPNPYNGDIFAFMFKNRQLIRWVKRKYKRFRGKVKLSKAYDWLVVYASHDRRLFSHWANGCIPY